MIRLEGFWLLEAEMSRLRSYLEDLEGALRLLIRIRVAKIDSDMILEFMI